MLCWYKQPIVFLVLCCFVLYILANWIYDWVSYKGFCYSWKVFKNPSCYSWSYILTKEHSEWVICLSNIPHMLVLYLKKESHFGNLTFKCKLIIHSKTVIGFDFRIPFWIILEWYKMWYLSYVSFTFIKKIKNLTDIEKQTINMIKITLKINLSSNKKLTI